MVTPFLRENSDKHRTAGSPGFEDSKLHGQIKLGTDADRRGSSADVCLNGRWL